MLALLLGASALVVPSRKLVELTPLKGMQLMQRWQLTEPRNQVTTMPDGKKLKAVRALEGDELLRRKACKQQFDLFGAATRGLAEADKSADPEAQKRTQVFASLPLEGDAPSALALVEQGEREWSVLSLCVSPGERRLELIVEAEAATLQALRDRGEAAGLRLRMLAAAEASLAASRDELRLVDETTDEASAWLYCAVGDAAGELPPGEVSGEASAATPSGEVAATVLPLPLTLTLTLT